MEELRGDLVGCYFVKVITGSNLRRNNMTKVFKIFSFHLIVATSAFSSSFMIPEDSLFVSQGIRKQTVVQFGEGGFSALVDGRVHQIESYDVSGFPSTLTEDQLKGFLSHGYLSLKQAGDNYRLEGITRALGGGDKIPPCLEQAGKAGAAGAIVGGAYGTVFPGFGTIMGAGFGSSVSFFSVLVTCSSDSSKK